MKDYLISQKDLETTPHVSAFSQTSSDESLRRDRNRRRLLGRLRVISSHFLTTSERQILEMYMFHNRSLQELSVFMPSRSISLVRTRVDRILRKLHHFIRFFDSDYKKIDQIAQRVLLPRQYIFLKEYLHLQSYRKIGLLYGITEQAIYCRLVQITERLEKNSETEPLVELIRDLQNRRGRC